MQVNYDAVTVVPTSAWTDVDFKVQLIDSAISRESVASRNCPEVIGTEFLTPVLMRMVNQTKRNRVEVARVMYEKDGELEWTDSKSGSKEKVGLGLSEIIEDGGVPVVAIHTHLGGAKVEASILSAKDIKALLGSSLEVMMMVHGQDVLSIHKTSSTPRMSVESLDHQLLELRNELLKSGSERLPSEVAVEYLSNMCLQFGLVVYKGKVGEGQLERVRMVN